MPVTHGYTKKEKWFMTKIEKIVERQTDEHTIFTSGDNFILEVVMESFDEKELIVFLEKNSKRLVEYDSTTYIIADKID